MFYKITQMLYNIEMTFTVSYDQQYMLKHFVALPQKFIIKMAFTFSLWPAYVLFQNNIHFINIITYINIHRKLFLTLPEEPLN